MACKLQHFPWKLGQQVLIVSRAARVWWMMAPAKNCVYRYKILAFPNGPLVPFTMTDSSRYTPTAEVSHVDALPKGTRLAEFEVVSLLGVGGFGMVYKAFDHSLHRTVAIKEFMPAALAGRSDGCSLWVRSPVDEPAFQSGLKSFVAEARTLAQFDHPSLVKVFRFWEANHTAYMVMPLYSGMTFKQARAQMRTPPPQVWLEQVLWSVLGALRTLHESQTLHRDISPDNIFLQDVGPPILLDLGAARHAINDRDHQHTAVLKVNYAPIEQYDAGDGGLQTGPWSDLYSLAAVVHGCLCNDTPLPSTLRSIRDRMVPFARVAKTVKSQFGQAYSPAFVAAIAHALALQPEDRPQDIDAFLRTMDLSSAPAGLETFDFRAELGDIWVEPTDQPGPDILLRTVDLLHAPECQLDASAPAVPAVRAVPEADALSLPAAAAAVPTVLAQTTVAPLMRSADSASTNEKAQDKVVPDACDTVMLDDGVDLSAFDTSDALFQEPALDHPAALGAREAQRALARAAKQKSALRRKKMWAAGAAVLLVVALGVGWAWQPAGVALVAAEETMTAPAALALEPATEAPAVLSELAALPEDLEKPELPASPPESTTLLVEVTPTQPAARHAARRAPKITAAEAEQGTAETPSNLALPASSPPAQVPNAKPEPLRQQKLCADTTFFTRSACVYRECAKPSNATLSMCVEHENRRKAQPMGN